MKNRWLFLFLLIICFSLSFLTSKEGIQNITMAQAENDSSIRLTNAKAASKAANDVYEVARTPGKSKAELIELKNIAHTNSGIVNSNINKVLSYQTQFNPKYMRHGKINSPIIDGNFTDIMKLQNASTYAVTEIAYLESKAQYPITQAPVKPLNILPIPNDLIVVKASTESTNILKQASQAKSESRDIGSYKNAIGYYQKKFNKSKINAPLINDNYNKIMYL